jgi:penicillin amidase
MRWLWRGPLLLIGFVLILVIIAFIYLRTSLPSYDTTIRLDGIDAPVQVLRDENAVPHIFAGSLNDALFALGFVHAQDRLWQMETQRLVAAGRVSELIGPGALRLDRLMRVLGVQRNAEASFETLPAEIQGYLTAYADGVNAFLASGETLPPEFHIPFLTWYTPEPWRPSDSLAWGRLMDVQLSSNWRLELLRAEMDGLLSEEQVDQLLPGSNAETFSLAGLLDPDALAALRAGLPGPIGPSSASNAWAVANSNTATGGPILANDPHLGLSTPILWYLARIETPEIGLTGATVPGVPGMVQGHNGAIAWAFTTTKIDTQDIFIEQLAAGSEDRYLTPTGPRAFDMRTEEIAVAGQEPESVTIRETRHGPVISDVVPEAAALAQQGYVLSLASPGLTGEDTHARALIGLNLASNWGEATAALSAWIAPLQNITYADIDGRVGLITPGHMPIRETGDGRRPVPGWTGQFDWAGMIPYEDLPQTLDPEAGYVVNANNPVVGPDYPQPIYFDGVDSFRAERIQELVAAEPQSIETSTALLGDTYSGAAALVLPLMLEIGAHDARSADAFALLRQWDYHMDRERPEPLIFSAWLRELNRSLFADELGPLFEEFWHYRPHQVAMALTDRPEWCDDVTTGEAESCEDTLRAALVVALDWLEERYGSTPADWRWGDAHIAALAHQVWSRVPLISTLVDNAIETDGGFYTVNRGANWIANEDQPFAHNHGAGFRAIYDMGDLANSRFMIATGQSGNPYSSYYGNLVERWRDLGWVRIHGTPADLAERGVGTLTLRPAER